MEQVLQEQLNAFLRLHNPEVSLSNLDSIVLSYLSEVLCGLSQDDSEVDVTPFTDIITAYIPEFAAVDSIAVREWVQSLLLTFSGMSSPPKQESSRAPQMDYSHSLPLERPEDQNFNPPKGLVFNEEVASNCEAITESDIKISPEQVALIADIFPGVSQERIKRILHRCDGNTDECVQVLLENAERIPTQQCTLQEDASITQPLHCEKLKEFITTRYGLVDTKDDSIIHRPVEPKYEGKKMIRYRDNQVVSTKGERFLVENKKDDNQSNAKTSCIRPLRRYRFH